MYIYNSLHPPTTYAHPENYCRTLHLRLCKSYINIQWLVLAASVSYILTNIITTLTDVMAARIPHSREWPVITNKSRWGNSLDANTKLSKIWCLWVRAWAHSQREVAKLSGIVRSEKDIKGPFTWTLEEIPVLYIHKVQSFLWSWKSTPSQTFWVSNPLYFLKQAAEHLGRVSFRREDG